MLCGYAGIEGRGEGREVGVLEELMRREVDVYRRHSFAFDWNVPFSQL